MKRWLISSRAIQTESKASGPGQVGQSVGALPPMPEGCGFDSWSGHMPRLWVQSSIGACTAGNPSMFLSHTGNSSLSLPPLPLSLKSMVEISSGNDKKKKKKERSLSYCWGGGLQLNRALSETEDTPQCRRACCTGG